MKKSQISSYWLNYWTNELLDYEDMELLNYKTVANLSSIELLFYCTMAQLDFDN